MNPSSEDASVSVEMPRYQSHKKVWALQIESIHEEKVTNGFVLNFMDLGYGSRRVDDKVVLRYMPVPGDYFVVYDDGYESISPKKAFEEGYTKL